MRWNVTLGAIGLAVVAACTEPARVPTYLVFFQNSETFSYGGAGCIGNPNTLYCGTWSPDTSVSLGELRGNPATTLVVNRAEYFKDPDTGLFTTADSQCHHFVLNIQDSGGELSGTFTEVTDCHAAGRRGTFTAVRGDMEG